jgi:hypothetical protein
MQKAIFTGKSGATTIFGGKALEIMTLGDEGDKDPQTQFNTDNDAQKTALREVASRIAMKPILQHIGDKGFKLSPWVANQVIAALPAAIADKEEALLPYGADSDKWAVRGAPDNGCIAGIVHTSQANRLFVGHTDSPPTKRYIHSDSAATLSIDTYKAEGTGQDKEVTRTRTVLNRATWGEAYGTYYSNVIYSLGNVRDNRDITHISPTSGWTWTDQDGSVKTGKLDKTHLVCEEAQVLTYGTIWTPDASSQGDDRFALIRRPDHDGTESRDPLPAIHVPSTRKRKRDGHVGTPCSITHR